MLYSFNVELATEYGVDESIILHNIIHWLRRNKANNKNFHEGKTWTFNTAKAFAELYPFWNARKISRVLTSLEDQGVLVSGNYNKVKYDRTKWYALADESLLELPFDKSGSRLTTTVQPIPDGKPVENTDVKDNVEATASPPSDCCDKKPNATEQTHTQEQLRADRQKIIDLYNRLPFPRMVKLTPSRKKHLDARIREWGVNEIARCFAMAAHSPFLTGKNNREWVANIDFLLNPNNFVKVMEGKYDEKKKMESV